MNKVWQDKTLLIAVGLLGLLTAVYFGGFERMPRELDLGYAQEARRNPFLAAEIFIKSQHKISHNLGNLAVLNTMQWQEKAIPPDATLILSNSFQALDDTQFTNLDAWLKAGGTLIFESQNPYVDARYGPADPVFEALGLTLASTDPDTLYQGDEGNQSKIDEDVQPKTAEPASDEAPEFLRDFLPNSPSDEETYCKPDFKRQSVPIPALSPTPEIRLDWGRGFHRKAGTDHSPTWWAGPAEQGVMAAYAWGDGRIIILSSLAIWQNQHIGCFDHAFLLNHLLAESDSLWLIRNQDSPALWRQLWQFMPFAVLAFGVALATWLWHHLPRFGPLHTHPRENGRAFMEHLNANGQLLWRTGQAEALVARLRQDTLAQINHRFSQFPRLSQQQQLELLQNLFDLPTHHIQNVLFSPYQHSLQGFIQIMAALSTIRNHL